MTEKKYELFEHTADLGLYIYGRDMEELFDAAAEALIAQITEPGGIRPAEKRRIEVKAVSADELLRSWMAEILYLYNAEGWLTGAVSFEHLDKSSLTGVLLGEELDPARHEVAGELKAVTWHRLKIERLEPCGLLRATVVCDV
ncbi:MAG: archease [Gemmatimonadota bacterium]|nr:archease [Gemmatimonadota bacterium]